MPKMTAKYSGAIRCAHNHNLPASTTKNQEELYQLLQSNGFFWDSQAKQWEEFDIEDADEPTLLIMVRVWADAEIVEEAADDIVRELKHKYRWQLVEKSTPYPCRPPKQRESRVYLKFLPRVKK
jgi:hypothetical protein